MEGSSWAAATGPTDNVNKPDTFLLVGDMEALVLVKEFKSSDTIYLYLWHTKDYLRESKS